MKFDSAHRKRIFSLISLAVGILWSENISSMLGTENFPVFPLLDMISSTFRLFAIYSKKMRQSACVGNSARLLCLRMNVLSPMEFFSSQ